VFAPRIPVQVVDVPASEGARAARRWKAIAGEVIGRWADLWEKQAAEEFAAMYAPDFRPEGRLAARDWLERRTRVMKMARFIEVEAEIASVREKDGVVTVEFWQRYASNAFRSRVMKSVDLVEVGGRWLIRGERVVLKAGGAAHA
jgi:hypothetical protein